jgi:hypothetical protein
MKLQRIAIPAPAIALDCSDDYSQPKTVVSSSQSGFTQVGIDEVVESLLL